MWLERLIEMDKTRMCSPGYIQIGVVGPDVLHRSIKRVCVVTE